MIVIHKSPFIIKEDFKLNLCKWRGFTQELFSTIPVIENSKVMNFWDNRLKEHHNSSELITYYIKVHNFHYSYNELLWIGENNFGNPEKEDYQFCKKLQEEEGFYITTAKFQEGRYIIELRFTSKKYKLELIKIKSK